MATTLLALFDSQAVADQAKAQLEELGIELQCVRIQANDATGDGFRLSARLSDEKAEEIATALKQAGALDVVLVQADWPRNKRYSLHNNVNAGSGVSAGEGDSEAGLSS